MLKSSLPFSLFFLLVFGTVGLAQKIHQPKLTPQNSGTTQGLIAVSPVNPRVVWASGRGGTFVVTTDGGDHWKTGVVPGAETVQFRDVQGVSERVAYLMSIGSNPTDFRIYRTLDGGATWTLQFQNQIPTAFYDCFAFWTPKRGVAHSDSVNGVFPDLRTTDGVTWQDISSNMPPALPGEASFSSSGTCVATQGGRNAWIATGGSATARVLATRDQGKTATSIDGGVTWKLTNNPPVTGAIFGLSYVGNASGEQSGGLDGGRAVVITANDGGAAWTPDEGKTWFPLPGITGFWAVAFASPKAGWLVGTAGRIVKVSF